VRRISKLSKGLTLLLLIARPAAAQVRLAPLTPRLSPAPAVSLSLPSFPSALGAPSLLTPAPLLASALPVLSAPAAAPVPASGSLSAAGKAAAPRDGAALSGRSLNAFWDGLSAPARDDAAAFAPPSGLLPEAAGVGSRASALPWWLALEDRTHETALEAAVKLARSTRAGRRAFDAAQKALDAEGRALPVDVLDLGRNYGEYDYLDNRLRLDRKLFNPGREAELAGTLAHELVHVAQHAQGLLSNALELEIEAHLLDLALMDELGLTAPPRTFARQTAEALAESPEKFIELLQAAVPGSPLLGESDFDEIAEQLEADLAKQRRKKGGSAAKLAAVIELDLERMRSKAGRAAYRAFSKKVLAELARRSAAAAR
jgi:hypothetical protein